MPAMTETRGVIVGGAWWAAASPSTSPARGWRESAPPARRATSGSTFQRRPGRGTAPVVVALTRLDDVERRVLPAARRRDRARPGVEHDAGEPSASPPRRERLRIRRRHVGLGQDLRPAARADRCRRGRPAFPATSLRAAGRLVPADRRPCRSGGLAAALAEGARRRGAAIRTGVRASGLALKEGARHEVLDDGRPIGTDSS